MMEKKQLRKLAALLEEGFVYSLLSENQQEKDWEVGEKDWEVRSMLKAYRKLGNLLCSNLVRGNT